MRLFKIVSLLSLIVSLAACEDVRPSWVPSGYEYHHDTYKAQPGPEAANLGYPYSTARNEYINSMWADVARALVDELESQGLSSAQPLYVAKLDHANAFNLSLDNALREDLRGRGYSLASAQGDNVTLHYQAFKPEDENRSVQKRYNESAPEKKIWNPSNAEPFIFVATLLQGSSVLTEVRQRHVMPGYGYVPAEGNIVPSLNPVKTPPEQKQLYQD